MSNTTNTPVSTNAHAKFINDEATHNKFSINKDESVEKTLERYFKHLQERTSHHFGYPYNLEFNLQELAPFLQFSINNLGDPFVESNYGVHSRAFEIEVLNYFAKLWKIPLDDYWGYVTTCGTEGNLYGLLLGREALPDGILYASKESHYSVFKAARFYKIPVKPISTLKSGEIDYDELDKTIAENKDKPAIINCNCGTTVKGAVDNIDKILDILKKNGYTEDRFYIHCDGALFALILPFFNDAIDYSFEKPIGSMSVSGHKFMGCPMPCGVVITRKRYMKNLEQRIDYINSVDTTIMGSRNGQAALCMWYVVKTKGKIGFAKDAKKCLDGAQLMTKKLRSAGVGCMLNKFSNTVVLEKPHRMSFIKKWQLACEGTIAHCIVMPNVTQSQIDEFVEELVKIRKEDEVKPVCISKHVGAENCLCEICMVNSSYSLKDDIEE